jgi:hypothetical protein
MKDNSSCCSKIIPKKWIISYKSLLKKRWDVFVLILAIINSFMIPMEQAFKPEYDKTIAKIILDNLVDIVFICDIFLSFLTSFRDNQFRECFEPGPIAGAYMSTSRFKVDVLSVLGSRFFSVFSDYMSLFGLFKLMRMFRLGHVIGHSNFDNKVKSALKIMKLCIYLLFYIHGVGCYMWIALEGGQGKRYYRDSYSDHYMSYYGDTYLDENGSEVSANPDYYMFFGPEKTFELDSWNRFTAEDTLGWE